MKSTLINLKSFEFCKLYNTFLIIAVYMQVFIFFLEANIKGLKSSACFTWFSVIYQRHQQLLQFSSDSKIRK